MTTDHTPKDNDFVRWVDEKSEFIKDHLSEKISATSPLTPQQLAAKTQNLEDVLLGHEAPKDELLREISDLQAAPPLSDEDLAQQALADGGEDQDVNTPE